MRSLRLATMILLSGVLAAGVAVSGCSSPKTEPEKPAGGGGGDAKDKTTPKGELKAVDAKGTGTLKGQVMFKGDPPKPAPIDFSKTTTKSDIPVCEMGKEDEKTDPTWRVGPNKGLENVVVWVEPPSGHYFKIPDNLKKPAEGEMKVDQPHCAFEPHMSVVFTSYYDPDKKEQVETGQKLGVINSAPIAHNTKSEPGNSLVNEAINKLVPAKTTNPIDVPAQPGKATEVGKFDIITLRCTIHPWMNAWVCSLDTPYYAKTDKEGNFEIKNVPAGTELKLYYWHESWDKKDSKTMPVTLKEGVTTDPKIPEIGPK